MKSEIRKVKIADIVDSNGNPFSVNQAYSFTEKHIREMANRDPMPLGMLNSATRTLCLLKYMQAGKTILNVEILNGQLKDGRHRLWAHVLNGDKEVEVLWMTKE